MTGSVVTLQQYNQQWRVGDEVQETRSQKPKLITMERGQHMDGDRYVLGFAPALRFLQEILCGPLQETS